MPGTTRGKYIGDLAAEHSGFLSISRPILRGIVHNWDDWETLFEHTYSQQLHLASEEHPLILHETIMNPKETRERTVQLSFETFNVPTCSLSNASRYVLRNSAVATGVIVECGDGVTQIIPVIDEIVRIESIIRINLAGRDIVDYLGKMLRLRGYALHCNLESLRECSNSICFVSERFNDDIQFSRVSFANSKVYKFNDGTTIETNEERFIAPEILFKPLLIGLDSIPLHRAVLKSVLSCPVEFHETLFANIRLIGGVGLYKGLATRLTSELSQLTKWKVVVRQESACRFFRWIASACAAVSPDLERCSIAKDQYEEVGPEIVHRTPLFF